MQNTKSWQNCTFVVKYGALSFMLANGILDYSSTYVKYLAVVTPENCTNYC